jgi:5'-3' exonuclease
MKKYVLVDLANLFFRARHTAFRAATDEERVASALHVTFASANKVVRKFKADHVVFALEGRSWRKDWYKPYKANRAVARAALTEQEAEQDQMFWQTFDELHGYLRERTNCSVIQHPNAEGDDIIARWIALHPHDTHTIISSDGDFTQLVAADVNLYNGITDNLVTTQGVFDGRGRRLAFKVDSNSKLKIGKPDPDFEPRPDWNQYALFLKCCRGDKGDNVFSAYPGVREKGTKNRVGLQEAYDDRDRRGYAWNNLMLQRWTDHNGAEHRVLDDYDRNRVLIDLTAQPDHIKAQVDQAIQEQKSHRDVGQVGSKFLKFCGRHELIKLSEQAHVIGEWLNQTYQGVLNDHS